MIIFLDVFVKRQLITKEFAVKNTQKDILLNLVKDCWDILTQYYTHKEICFVNIKIHWLHKSRSESPFHLSHVTCVSNFFRHH